MKDIEKLRYWCVKILPLVYDNSLSYYETLCKVTQKLNEVIENYNTIDEYIKELLEKGGYLDKIRQQIAPIIEQDWFASSNRDMRELVWLDGNLYWITKPVQAGNKYIDGVNVARVSVEDLINLLKSTVVDSYETTLERASRARHVGDWIWYNHHLAEITKNIAMDELYNENVNFKYITIYEIYLREKKAREDGDNALTNSVNAEKTAREKADKALGGRIDAEASARSSADEALSKRIDNIVLSESQSVGAVSDRLNTEIQERKDADASFTTQINDLNTKVNLLEPKEPFNYEETGTQGQSILGLLQILATVSMDKINGLTYQEKLSKLVMSYKGVALHVYSAIPNKVIFGNFSIDAYNSTIFRTVELSITSARSFTYVYNGTEWTFNNESNEDASGANIVVYYVP